MNRHEILFCHDLLNSLSLHFLGISFEDSFPQKSKSEVYFVYNNRFFLIEAKSESEVCGGHPGWKGTFLNLRRSIRNLNLKGAYNKWLIYLGQLHDYTTPQKKAPIANDYAKRYCILGLPLIMYTDFKLAIDATNSKSGIARLTYRKIPDLSSRTIAIFMREEILDAFLTSIKTNY